MKPLARGYIPQIAFVISLCACYKLINQSDNTNALIANFIYSFTLVSMYGISALYHTPMWDHRMYHLLRRIDHATIFTLIAGTATPLCMLGLKNGLGTRLLCIFWGFAAVGMFWTMVWTHGPKWLRAIFYVALGWIAVPYLSEFNTFLGWGNVELLLIGGVIYTVGALVYASRWPNPFPHVFGYHEIFHLFVFIASYLHFAVIYNLTSQ
jgi:hemolysin III